MNNIEINQTIDDYSSDEFGEFGEGGDEDRVAVDFSEEGFVKNITIETDEVAGMGDVQAGIEFIYHMREHLVDVSVAKIYLLVVYAAYMWIKKKLS